jgi:hypothetical protein
MWKSLKKKRRNQFNQQQTRSTYMNMTVAKLTNLGACFEGIQYFKDHKFKTVEQAVTEILKTNHDHKQHWSNWLISHSLSKMDRIRYAVYAAEQVIDIFEKKYPKDKRPREAIQAVKRYIKNPTEENKERCKDASYASWTAYSEAAATSRAVGNWATISATCAANAIYDAATSCTAPWACWAYSAASDASWASDTFKELEKIIKYGLKLLSTQN